MLTIKLQNLCGMSVVGNDYEKLKRYNLAEIGPPSTPVQSTTVLSSGNAESPQPTKSLDPIPVLDTNEENGTV
jgi:hypothetical protein